MEKKDLRSLTIEEMTELAESMGQKTFRGKRSLTVRTYYDYNFRQSAQLLLGECSEGMISDRSPALSKCCL